MTVKLATYSSEATVKAPEVFPLLHLLMEVKGQGLGHPVTMALMPPRNQRLWLNHFPKTPFLNAISMATKFHHGEEDVETMAPWLPPGPTGCSFAILSSEGLWDERAGFFLK